ncbi:MAG: TldD/PmbA family protein [Alphaproteobacteria bacterium]|nr:TldD/PmbA family protein [Alphaproteobacteria bacterium]
MWTPEWFGVDRDVLRRVLSVLAERGADHGEIFLQHARTTRVVMEDGILGRAEVRVDHGAGLRAVVGDRVGYAFTEDLSERSLTDAARTAASIAQGGVRHGPVALVDGRPQGDRYRLQRGWGEVAVRERIDLVHRVEALARDLDPRVQQVQASLIDVDERVVIASIDGRVTLDDRPMARLGVQITAVSEGRVRTGSSNLAGRRGLDWFDEGRLQQVAKEAVERTVVQFDAVQPRSGEWPVILAAGASGILLHEAVGHGMEADFARRDETIYSSMIGRRVAPPFVTIVDDGTQAGERGSIEVDDEGTEGQHTVLVREGVLETFLHDRVSAAHYGLRSTGSGRRESYRHPPMPRMRSTYMASGPNTAEEIVRSVKYGILAETFANGQVQIGAGDYTFFVRGGWLVEDGRVTAPIRDVNIIGNGPETLERVTMVGDDLRLDTGGWTCGKDGQRVAVSQGMPTVLVSRLTVGGA